MKVVAVIQARMQSTRLPGKVMMELDGMPVLRWVYNAAFFAPGVDEVWVATSTEKADDVIESYCKEKEINYVRGSESDVLSRFMLVAERAKADVLIRLTGDCPLHDPDVIGAVIRLYKNSGVEYASNIDPPTWPDGLDVEIFSRNALEHADAYATRRSDRDCVTRYIARNRETFGHATLICPIPGLVTERWVLDTENDLKFCQLVAEAADGDGYLDILNILDDNPEWRLINQMHPRNERFYEGINSEELGDYHYSLSEEQLSRARDVIPLGCQTFSKSYVQFPDKAPYFVSHGDGAYTYDLDGNEYVDLMGGLLPVILGHRDPDVDAAVRHQLTNGITLSLATTLEEEVASMICGLIPSADMVRFGKNGSDATTVSVRLARAFTGRDRVLSIGYHGWHDTFIGDFDDRGRGVPEAVRELSCSIDTATAHAKANAILNLIDTEDFACVILEPEDNPEFLRAVREACTVTGTILVFDEIITWPRWHINGAQGLFSITPDLTCLSKAMANGMPISAICGRRDIMMLMEPPENIFYSGTFQGETLSLAAAKACIQKILSYHVVDSIKEQNDALNRALDALNWENAEKHEYAGLTRVSFKDVDGTSKEQSATLFRQTMAANGVLIINSNNLSFMHREPERKRIVRAYEASFQAIQEAIREGDIAKRIGRAIEKGADIRRN